MHIALTILQWSAIAFAILVVSIVWVMILVASVLTITRFVKQYNATSAQMAREEQGEDEGPPLHF